MLDAYRAMSDTDQQKVKDWLVSTGGEGVLRLDLPRVERVGLAAALVG